MTACFLGPQPSSCAEAHAAGGAWVMSRPLAEEFVRLRHLFMVNCWLDDTHLGHFLRYVLDIHVQPLPGIKQEPRFNRLEMKTCDGEVCGVPSCAQLLPPPVYSVIDQMGSLVPFAPLDSTRLA